MQLTLMDVALLILLWCGNHAYQSRKKLEQKSSEERKNLPANFLDLFSKKKYPAVIGIAEMGPEEKFLLEA